MLTEPVAKELIRDPDLGRPVLDPLQADRCKPRIINLFWHLTLNVGQRFLPHRGDSHNPCIRLNTQAYSHLWITPSSHLVFTAMTRRMCNDEISPLQTLLVHPEVVNSALSRNTESIPKFIHRERSRRAFISSITYQISPPSTPPTPTPSTTAICFFTRHPRRRVWISDYNRMIALKNLFDQVVIRETLLTFVV